MIPHQAFIKPQDRNSDCMLLLRPGQRLLLLVCVMLFCWVVSNVFNGLILAKFGISTRTLRVAAVIQSMVQIILPAIVTAMMVSRKPACLLAIERPPRSGVLLLGVCTLIVSVPLLNLVIHLNAMMQLPAAMAGVEQWLRHMEDSAGSTIATLQGGTSVADLVMSVLIVGIMAGLGEELLFRGTIQRLLSTGGLNPHAAVWITAALFSAVHMQFFGFVPRLLLGALFGYMLYWSGTLWLPVCVHAANNIIYVSTHWMAMRSAVSSTTVDTVGTDGSWPIILTSALLTTATLTALYHKCRRKRT